MPTNRTVNARGKRLVTTALMLALAAGVAGCGTSRMTTGSIGRTSGKPLDSMSAGEVHNATAALGQSYSRNPNDKRIATSLGRAESAEDGSRSSPWTKQLPGSAQKRPFYWPARNFRVSDDTPGLA